LQADLILFGGRIYTMDQAVPLASALAVRGGRIIAVGDHDAVRDLGGPETEHINLKGRIALPGFTDAHLHLLEYGLSLTGVQLDGLDSSAKVVSAVAERARHTPAGEWIRGYGWNRNLWPGCPFPTKHELDPVSPDNPVYLLSKDMHSGWANSLALKAAGLDRHTPDPPGGQFLREDGGARLTGVLKERAMEAMAKVAGPFSREELVPAVLSAMQSLHRMGVVGVHTPERANGLAGLQSVWLRGELALRVNVMIPADDFDHARKMGLAAGFGDEYLRLLAVKTYSDGALGSRTADMFEPYETDPQNLGVEVTDSDRLNRLIAECSSAGWGIAIHAIGDRANCRVLDALEEHWPTWSSQGIRPRIEHVQLISPEDAPRLGAMGVIASMQPIHCTSDMLMAEEHWGARCSGAYAWRSLMEGGAALAFGSDAPVEKPDVLRGIYAAVTRTTEDGMPAGGWYAEQCLMLPEAVYAYTLGAAYASGEERIKGSISVGKQADIVVLSQDIFEGHPQDLLATRVDATIVGGDVVFGAD
jgi:predicted amidohydrolase YtcJ